MVLGGGERDSAADGCKSYIVRSEPRIGDGRSICSWKFMNMETLDSEHSHFIYISVHSLFPGAKRLERVHKTLMHRTLDFN